MSQTYQIAALGDRESVLGFRALGFQTFAVETEEEARTTLHQLAREDFAIIYVTEQLATSLTAEIEHYKDSLTPAIILIPGKEGSLGIGMSALQSAVERAVGADIL